ncbi:MAG: DNA/RNA nuclease SfsA [Thermoplasmata archaeon]
MNKKLMDIHYDEEGVFLSRENRFLGKVKDKEGKILSVHIRDPGRLEEILYRGNRVRIKKADNPDRKTGWDLIAGKVKDQWVLVNSGYHREITEAILEDDGLNPFGGYDSYKAEKKLGESRIDFLIEKGDERTWVEVKGCTLARDKKALFPDAPTKRGARHVRELMRAVEHGDSAALIILVFRSDSECFAPNEATDPEFARIFHDALERGVSVHPLVLQYLDEEIFFHKKIPVCPPT